MAIAELGRRRPETARSVVTITGHAFGIGIRSPLPLPIPTSPSGSTAGRHAELELATAGDHDRIWRPRGSRSLWRLMRDERRVGLAIDHHPDLGYRIYAPRFGRYLVSNDGHRILAAIPTVAAWRWQRLLFAQPLPLAATLQGLEPLHASGVVFGERAFAFTASSGTGKTSIAAHLVARGASLLSDDVVALEAAHGELLAHPAAATMSVWPEELEAMSPLSRNRFGAPLGGAEKQTVPVPVADRPAPLRAVYFLERTPSAGRLDIRPMEVDPLRLLSSCFVPYVETPERLVNHLTICARIADRVEMFRIVMPSQSTAAGVARAVEEHAEERS